MTVVRIIDPADEADLRSIWEVIEADSAERPYDDSQPWESFLAAVRAVRSDTTATRLVVEDDGRIVGVAILIVFLLDNPHLADLGIIVHPDHRRRGHGAALLAELERLTAETGRTSWSAGFHAPLEGSGSGAGFAERFGYLAVSDEEVKAVDLDEAMPGWGTLDADVAEHLGDYRVETFVDRVPDELRDGFLTLASAFLGEIPTGDLDLENATWTPQRLLEHEERMQAMGKRWVVAMAVAPDGRAVGFSEVSVHPDSPGSAWIGGTLVVPDHRGHRLGYAMKLASHRFLREVEPRCRHVLTGNANVNAPMNAVNAAMGYRIVEQWIDVQKRVGGTEA